MGKIGKTTSRLKEGAPQARGGNRWKDAQGSVQSHCRCTRAQEDQGNLLTSQGGSKSGHFHIGTAKKHKAGWWS